MHNKYLQETVLDCNLWVLIQIEQSLMSVLHNISHICMLINYEREYQNQYKIQ